MASSFSYGLRVLLGRLRVPGDRTCPYCRSANTERTGRKHIILQLRTCYDCGLRYRYPKDDPRLAESFYQNGYVEETVTELPTDSELVLSLIHI